jgi:D-alanyl-lipoteichoic acid acyltransferase DltB (MBOAT superfamily)
MLYNSYQFIFGFLPLVLLTCFLLARYAGPGAAQLLVIAASIAFYAAWNVAYVPLLLGSIIFNYWLAQRMIGAAEERRRRLLLVVAIGADLALLGYYKYTNYLVSTVNSVTGSGFEVAAILLPLGISFYTFQQITLLVDVSRGQVKEFRFRDFLLFVIFFPHLIAGPIVHHREMMPQFAKASWRFDWHNMAVGISLFAIGLFKKTVLADGMAEHVTRIFAAAGPGRPVSLVYAWAAAFGFMLQLYFDFSGYSEMALGLARMFGIRLPMNFNSPLKSFSIIEFWSRWHITLTRFLTAYLYTPMVMALTRRRMAKGKKILAGPRTTIGAFLALIAVPTVITMFLAGVWHGAGDQYVIVGLLFGVYIVVNHAWRMFRPRFWKGGTTSERVMRPVWSLLTLVCVSIALVFFHAETVSTAVNIVSGMAGFHGITLPTVISTRLPGLGSALSQIGVEFSGGGLNELLTILAWISVLLLVALGFPNALEMLREHDPAITDTAPSALGRAPSLIRSFDRSLVWQPTARWAAVTALLTGFGVLAMNRVAPFLYWQF